MHIQNVWQAQHLHIYINHHQINNLTSRDWLKSCFSIVFLPSNGFNSKLFIINIWATQKFPKKPRFFCFGPFWVEKTCYKPPTNRFPGIPHPSPPFRLSEPAFRRAIGPMSHPGHGVEQGPQLGIPQAEGGGSRRSWKIPMFETNS